MRFAASELLLLSAALLPVAVLAVWLRARLRRKAVERFARGEVSVPAFVEEVSLHRRTARGLLLLAALAAGFGAAARPQWGARLEPVTRSGVDVVLVLDTSRSMLAEDVPPSRLELSRAAARTLAARLAGHQIAVVTFAGQGTVVCPLTLDTEAVRLFLDAVDVDTVPVPGTALADALRAAARALGPVSASPVERGRAVVLFSDGEDHEGGMGSALGALRAARITVHAVGTGTPTGAPVPIRDPEGRVRSYVRDRSGRVVMSQLEESVLERLALEGGGRYYRASAAGSEIAEIARAIQGMEASESGAVLRTRYEERFQIPLALALACLVAHSLVAERRRGLHRGRADPGAQR
jgi:Ca-activated chloride channel homolog